MPCSVELDPAAGFIEVRLLGPVGGADLRRVTTQAASLQRQSGMTKFLVDAREWEAAASAIDIYDLADKQYWAEAFDRRSRIAVVLPTSSSGRDAAQFYEDVCRNRGWNAQVCPDRASAVAWLTGPAPHS